MSRRPNPAADRAEQNRQTLKSLVKLETNKSCADCKRNKHPRWASWNLGIFICIRCSGIHRGMGTHISRVKSVDLDSWTDEQLQSMLKWGNARANKYWEAKLAPGHVPSEAKIENFIRTKYESKRWVMDGEMPDPSTLDVEGDDDVPLNVVQQKVKIEQSTAQRVPSVPTPATRTKPQPAIDLFGDDPTSAPPRPSTTGPPGSRTVPPKSEPAPPKHTKAGDSLLGLDFLGGSQSGPPSRPSSTAQTSSATSRPDLKQSILSLYASTPKPPSQPQPQHARQESFGNLTSPGATQQQQPQQSAYGGLNDAFSGLSFSSQPPQQQPKPSAFSGLDTFSNARSPATSTTSSLFSGGGSFFDSTPKSPPVQSQPQMQKPRNPSSAGGFGDLSALTSPAPPTSSKPATASSSGMGDLLDLSMPSVAAPTSKPLSPPSTTSPTFHSAFNLSQPAPPPKPVAAPAVSPAPTTSYSGFSNMDAWGSSDAWASSTTTRTTTTTTAATSSTSHSHATATGWGQTATPHITQDDDFGSWSSATPAAPSATTLPQTNTHAHMPNTSTNQKPGGGFGGEDLFSNVWE